MKDTQPGKTHFADDDTLKYIAKKLENIAELERKCDRLKIGHDRYETARRMNSRQWSDAFLLAITTGKPFDEIIDELRPFYFPERHKEPGG